MSNVFWYIGVAIISLTISVYTIYSVRGKYSISTFIVFYLFTAAITWIGEFTVLGLFNSYAYKTGISQNIWAQNLMGHLLLNSSMFPAVAIVVVAYSLEYVGMAIIAVIFVVVEYIFVKLGIYEQHWWRYYMSAINVIVFLIISKKWFYKMRHERHGLTRSLTYYFVAFIFIHLPTPILLLIGKQHYQLSFVNHLVGDFYRSSIMVSFIHHLIITAVLVYCVCNLKKWYWKLVPFLFSIISLLIYAKMNILVADDNWKLIYYIIIQQIAIGLFMLLERYTLK